MSLARVIRGFRPAWRRALTPLSLIDDDDDAMLARVRAAQMNELAQFVQHGSKALFGLAAVLLAAAARSPWLLVFAAWIGVMCAATFVGAREARRRLVAPAETLPAARVRAAAARAGGVGLLWGLLFPAILRWGDPSSVMMVSALHISMIGAGAFTFAAVPLSALAFVGALWLSLLGTMMMIGAPFEGYVFVGVLGWLTWRGVAVHSVMIARTVAAHAGLRERNGTIELLLRQFEDAGRDWIWRADAALRLTYISPRFGEIVGAPIEGMIGKPVFDTPWRATDPAGRGRLVEAIEAHRPFRALEVAVEVGDEARCWSFSATPQYDAAGAFAGYLGLGTDITEQRRATEQIERMATSDGLTGLANRATVRGHMQGALEAAQASGGAAALLMIDLDRFKAVNDTLGHPIGDELLRLVAARMLVAVGATGVVARLGGDEFLVVLRTTEAGAAERLANQIIDQVSEAYPLRGASLRIGASVGIAVAPRDASTIDEWMRAADLALYRAKADGRGVARRYEPALHEEAEDRRVLEAALRAALTEDQLSLAFQPIYDLTDGRVRGFEALLRWKHPVLGQVSPVRFIPVAEDLGLIDTIGEWVIRTACAWAARWPDEVGIAVNLSPIQLVNPRLPGIVLHALASNGIAPDRLELEITENVFLNESEATRGALAQLASLGVRIGLDDFGTGYSSLGYLRTSVFNTIKIDRSFVRDAVDGESQSAEIVRHIVSLAKNLGMETIAEGAETKAEMDAVRALGCGSVQGFYCGRPMSPEDATALVLPEREARAA